MKVDGLGVILAIILLPIILVVTFYVQLEVDTISKENQYNTNLLNATYDAMSAFEINTANEKLSSVADSMRSIILASNNIFLNTLATNFGISNASKEYLQPYIPAVLYTLYDGYYIYSPTEVPKVAEKTETTGSGDDELTTTKGYVSVGDEGTEYLGGVFGDVVYEDKNGNYTINKDEARKDTDYILKSYVQYSARYKKDNKDVTINYALDNYLNIIGNVGNVYYTKTGYLIQKGLVNEVKIDGQLINLDTTNEDDVKNAILGMKTNATETTIKAVNNASVKINDVEINSNFKNIKDKITQIASGAEIFTISEAETYLNKCYETYNNTPSNELLEVIQMLEYEIQKCKAVAYYASSACFSNWVYDNLGDLTYGNIIEDVITDGNGNLSYNTTSGTGNDELYFDFHNPTFSNMKIFDETQDPEDKKLNFYTHKMEVIKNSIKYNLNLSMSAYSKMEHPYECSLPILLDEEWEKILNNISIVSFMQGWDCGLDIYNNYQIVSSTNNELTVTPSEIYYVKKSDFNNSSGIYHRIDCPFLKEDTNDEYISFKSKEVKYDKQYNKTTDNFSYDHRNLACYTCINTNNYEGLFIRPNSPSYYDRINSLKKSDLPTEDEKNNERSLGDSIEKKRAGYIGIANERQKIYKTNALPVSEGYEIVCKTDTVAENNAEVYLTSTCPANKVKKLLITLNNIQSKNTSGSREPILKLNITVGNKIFENYAINLDQSREQTIVLNVSDINTTINKINFQKTTPGYNVSYTIKSIKAIYK